ncbi:phage tail protein [Paraburkholderia aromaticivorans]|uniref:phage tail protein n=1 Tax=Paraburkholderia aromaticivorans TaxID=2026199 RepID=UPI00197DDEA6|nr:hypothetical protein [Paraburkholderia aromaticivorans]
MSTFRALQRAVGNRAVQRLMPQPPSSVSTHASAAESLSDRQQLPVPQNRKRDEPPIGNVPPPSETSPSPAFVQPPEAAPSVPASRAAEPAKSAVDAEATGQARLIDSDSAQSEAQVARIAATRRAEVANRFAAIRIELSDFFRNASTGVQRAISAKQAEMAAAVASVTRSVQKLIADAVAAVRASANHIREAMSSFIESATSSLQGRVKGIVEQIFGFVNAIPGADIPGVTAIRDAATGLLKQASGAVNAALSSVLGFIRQALSAAMETLVSIVGAVGGFASMALSAIVSQITRVSTLVASALSRVTGLVVSGIGRVLSTALNPGLNRLESQITNAIGKGEQSALSAIRKNRQQHIKALADAVHPAAGGGNGGNGKSATGDALADIRAIAQEAMANNRAIIQTFDAKISGTVASLFHTLAAGVAKVIQGITTGLARAVQTAVTRVGQVVQALEQAVESVIGLVQSVVQPVMATVAAMLDWMRSVVQAPVDTLLSAATNISTRIGNLASTLARALLSGGGVLASIGDAIRGFTTARGPITKPRPPGGPITLPGVRVVLAAFFVVGALIVYLVPELAIVITALVALGLTEAAAFIVVGVAVIVVLVLALLVLVLLIRLITKRLRPRPPSCKITTRTSVSAPDGSPDSRASVGVNEQVELTASTAVSWSAKGGTITPTGPSTSIWTAPDKASSCVITAQPPGGARSCSVTVVAHAPSHRSLINPAPQSYTAGRAGSGFVAQVVIQPTNVSFSRIQVREDTVMSVASGYYDTVLHWNNIPHKLGAWLAVDVKNSGIRDTVGSVAPDGTPPPFSKGKFHWPIPQEYRVGGTGSPINYSTGDHIQEMTGSTGEETTTKEGAVGGPRTP